MASKVTTRKLIINEAITKGLILISVINLPSWKNLFYQTILFQSILTYWIRQNNSKWFIKSKYEKTRRNASPFFRSKENKFLSYWQKENKGNCMFATNQFDIILVTERNHELVNYRWDTKYLSLRVARFLWIFSSVIIKLTQSFLYFIFFFFYYYYMLISLIASKTKSHVKQEEPNKERIESQN